MALAGISYLHLFPSPAPSSYCDHSYFDAASGRARSQKARAIVDFVICQVFLHHDHAAVFAGLVSPHAQRSLVAQAKVFLHAFFATQRTEHLKSRARMRGLMTYVERLVIALWGGGKRNLETAQSVVLELHY